MEEGHTFERALRETKDGEDEPCRIEIGLTIDVVNEDRVRLIGAELLARSGRPGPIEALRSLPLSELAFEVLVSGRAAGLVPDDLGLRIAETLCPKDPADLWDSATDDRDGFWFRHMPETDVDGLFSEEKDLMTITREKDGFWLGEESVVGQSRYATLTAAKSAGDRIWNAADAAQAGSILKDAGLDPTEWTFHQGAGIRFVRSDGASVEADADGLGDEQRWHAFLCRSHGTDAINEDPTDNVGKALALLPPLK